MSIEALARLVSVRDVCAHEVEALESLDDPRLEESIAAMRRLMHAIDSILKTLEQPSGNGHSDA